MTRFTVNGNPVEYLLDPGTPLLWALRDASHLTGAKYGCDDASCGACTVIADGEAVRACTVSITAMEGRFITTIEALSPARNHPLQQAFLAENAVQCGFCTPGMLMAAAALLERWRGRGELRGIVGHGRCVGGARLQLLDHCYRRPLLHSH